MNIRTALKLMTVAAVVLLLASAASPQAPAPAHTVAAPAAHEADVPGKWFMGARGYDKALELQKTTGADIFIWFSRPNTPDEKGLCNWFEDKGLNALPVRKLLRDYIKVSVVLPGNPDNQKLAEKFRFSKTPAVYVVHPDGWRNRCQVFEWENKRPKLLDPEKLAELFRQNSSARYQPSPAEPQRD